MFEIESGFLIAGYPGSSQTPRIVAEGLQVSEEKVPLHIAAARAANAACGVADRYEVLITSEPTYSEFVVKLRFDGSWKRLRHIDLSEYWKEFRLLEHEHEPDDYELL